MKKGISTLLLLLMAPSAHADWSKHYENYKASVPIIFMSGSLCSGALVSSELILTAAHCVNRLRPVTLSWIDDIKKYESAEIVAFDSHTDVAFIRLKNPSQRRPIPVLPKDAKLLPGDQVATIGHPTTSEYRANPAFDPDGTFIMSSGIISKVTDRDVITDLSVSPGNSGGPVIDKNGRIVGVISRKRIGMGVGDISYAANHTRVHELLSGIDKPEPLRLSRAKATGGLTLNFVDHSLMPKINREDDMLGIGFRFDFIDRIRLQYDFDIDADGYSYSSYGIGYKFEFILPNRSAFFLTFSVDAFKYSFIENGERIIIKPNGYSVHFMHSAAPVALKYSRFSHNDQNEQVVSIEVPLSF